MEKGRWEEDKRIQMEDEREQQRLEEECRTHENREQRFKEEKETIRREREQGIRPSSLTDEQRHIRKVLQQRCYDQRARAARAEADKEYGQKLRKRQKGKGTNMRISKAHVSKLTEEQKKPRRKSSRETGKARRAPNESAMEKWA